MIKLFFMLNRAEHKILTARNTRKSKEISSPKPVSYSANTFNNENNLSMINISCSVKLGTKTLKQTLFLSLSLSFFYVLVAMSYTSIPPYPYHLHINPVLIKMSIRAVETFKRKRVGQTNPFRVMNPHK